MCGIAGIIRFDGGLVDRATLERACNALRHRGPDDAGVWIAGNGKGPVGLAATRLAILDPTLAGHQPMHRHDGRYTLVYNGEIYNFHSLRAELTALGEAFVTNSDTEVLLAACARWGPQSLDRLNGMWAFAFFDAHTRTGFLARDRFGVKPLFYAADAHRLAFASELRPLVHLAGLNPGIDSHALAEHLIFGYISGDQTIYQSARRLEPGHYLPFSSGAVGRPIRYYDPVGQCGDSIETSKTASANGDPQALHRAENPRGLKSAARYSEVCTMLRRTLAEAVVRRRVSDVPIGAFLSGGLDSTIIVSHLAAAMGRPVKTFSVGYAADRSYDETAYARLAARALGTEHHELILGDREILGALPKILDHLGEPVGDSSILPTALVSQFARQQVTVALSGDGGDELFGGYWRYMAHDSLRGYLRLPRMLRAGVLEPLLARMGESRSSSLSNRVRQFRKLLRGAGGEPRAEYNPGLPGARADLHTRIHGAASSTRSSASAAFSRHLAWSCIMTPEAEAVLHEAALVESCLRRTLQRAESLTAQMDPADSLNRVLAFDLQHQLPADMLQKVDLASMMHSLEVRTPFLDPAVVHFALTLPSEFKIKSGLRKRILTDAYRGHLPDEILDRPKKGFEVPVGEYFRGPLRSLFHDTVTRETVESLGLLSYQGVESVFAAHQSRRQDHADLLFALLSLCWWKQRHP